MISIELNSGLGNMMFQAAFIESLGKRYNFPVGYANYEQNLRNMRGMGRLIWPAGILKNIDLTQGGHYSRREKIPDTYKEIVPVDGTLYFGYAVSEKNFYSKEFIWNLFEPSDEIKERLSLYIIPEGACSIHVRRGDYVNNPGFVNLGVDYYERAMKEIPASMYLIFSDDIPYCQRLFGNKFIYIEDYDCIELFLMSMCDNNIIANSTFSWWGAYLNQNPDKKVVCPSEWVADGRCLTSDLVPKEWLQI